MRLIRITGRALAWELIAAALGIMAIRRAIALHFILLGVTDNTLSLYSESIGLLISLLLLVGVARIGPVFSAVRQTEQALREAHHNLSTVVQTSPLAIIVSNTDMKVTLWNRAAEKIFGWRADEVLNAPNPTIPQDQTEEVQQLRKRLIAGETVEYYETIRKRRSGERIHVALSAAPVYDAQNHVAGLLGVISDISERKKAEESLRQSEERFFKIFSSNPIGISVSTLAEGRFVDLNDAFLAIFGYRREEVIGHTSFELNMWVDPEDRHRMAAFVREQGRAHHFEAQLRRKSGEIRSALFAAEAIEIGGERFILALINDITERKKTEEALRHAKEFAESIVETANVLFIHLDVEGNILKINAAAEEISGYRRDEIEGKNWFETLVPKERYPYVWEEFRRLAPQGKMPVIFENPILGKGGEERQILWKNSQLRQNGAVVGSISFGMDITERKRAEEQLAASLHEKEVLLKEIHHRVKNNLQVISSLLSLQASQIKDKQQRDVFLESQHRVRTMALVHEKLYRSGSLASIDFSEYLEGVTRDLAHSFGREGVTLALDVEKIPLQIDVALPCGLIVNELVTNALKHAFPELRKGEVTVALHRLNDSMLELSVSDNGIGFPAGADLRAISSMGMTLVHSLTEQISGTLALDRSNGTRFVVKFPA